MSCSSSIPPRRSRKPHVVCVPLPCQGDITPMLNFSRLLHHSGFYITFVHSEFNYNRIRRCNGSDALNGYPDFHFRTIPDGLPPSDSARDIASLCISTQSTCFGPFSELLRELDRDTASPPVTCVVADASMSFALDAAKEFGLPNVVFWAPSACAYLAYFHIQELVRRGLTPATDPSGCVTDEEYVKVTREWLPGDGPQNLIRFQDLPTFIRTTDPDDPMIKYILKEIDRCRRSAGAILINTFHSLEAKVLDTLTNFMEELPPIYSIGPLNLSVETDELIRCSLWKEESECLKWLDAREPESVVYVNLGSIAVVSKQQLLELASGLAASNKAFLWVIRPDVVAGESADLPVEFMEETKDRGMVARWCPQEEVLNHPAVGAFLSHMGWNSTLESICGGVPMLCWPFFADQQTNCRFACHDWGIGKEIDDLKSGEVKRLVIELLDGNEGKEMRMKARELKKMAMAAVTNGGSSHQNLEQVIHKMLLTSGSDVANM